MFLIFIVLLGFFLNKKAVAMKKGAHSGGFSTFNFFVLYSIYFLLFMRIIGSLYTFIVGIVSMTPLFNDDKWKLSYEILDEIVFPIRDFIEVLFFSYLFYFQSYKRTHLKSVNEMWTQSNEAKMKFAPMHGGHMRSNVNSSRAELEQLENQVVVVGGTLGTIPLISTMEGDHPVGDIYSQGENFSILRDDRLVQTEI